jgi:carbonic anhydrase
MNLFNLSRSSRAAVRGDIAIVPPGHLAWRGRAWQLGFLLTGLALALMPLRSAWAADTHAAGGHAAEPAKKPAMAAPAPATARMAASAAAAPAGPVTAKEIGDQVREAVDGGGAAKKNLTLMINGKEKKFIVIPAESAAMATPAKKAVTHGAAPSSVAAMTNVQHIEPAVPGRIANPMASRQYIRAKAHAMAAGTPGTMPADAHAATAGEVHWSYDGATGPQAWGSMKPDFNVCAIGKRQSPINIEDSVTLQGPAEPLRFNYQPSSGTVVNNGHTIQVDLYGDNAITVRGSEYKLIQFHFHHPSEERVNFKAFSMVAHLVHKNLEGQLAVVAVLLEPGVANALINKVWTYMPLDSGDRVRMPAGLLDMNELLPADQRYYQFMGSLTTPPCSENVLWMVLKQPIAVSREQIRLFSQLFPNNARPVQSVNGRAIRNAQ